MTLASLGVIIPGIAALYEFGVKGRKRLGYRVQMDTTAMDVVQTPFRGALGDLRKDGVQLTDPTVVLLRIENAGATGIDENDYAAPVKSKAGITVRFPDRTVVGMVVTELSNKYLKAYFEDWDELTVGGDTIELPRVQLNKKAHYKVLAVLDRAATATAPLGQYQEPEVSGGIRGGVGQGGIDRTESRTGPPRTLYALIGLLAAIVVAQLFIFVRSDRATPLDCAAGRLTVTGSTAFEPIVREAARSYADLCPDASFSFDMRGSGEGLLTLNEAARQAGGEASTAGLLAFSDGEKPTGMPGLVPRPIAFFLFTIVVNAETGVHDLAQEQIQRIYRGEITNWKEIGGRDLPIRLISRNPGSGTRAAFQHRVLGGRREPGSNSDDCRNRDPGTPPGVVRCARDSTEALLRAVAETPGALGYSELGAAAVRDDLTLVRINGQAAEVIGADHGTYPFWETEFGYTHGEPDARSLAASFLRYLTNQVGADIIRANGDRPCAELANPQLCRPS
ncbi:substrate-binding domain-containing protein [Actinoplanes regularis]|uniref:Phosphate ABC transporter substrate-binding protein, PhoT family n=1 Tax=Actinoplanes regularis TaxID=52697 RepID=A0A239F799_9ACTN|nr:substrate-binding domain-containing protein [Actinoplanes regularis]GIE90006.1 phosphate-binding protein [Actinoplanes regularis]SNS52631.1 phosphate ABC transporter substrate-binding protein, PhoT family [Actinoplanes regularis]